MTPSFFTNCWLQFSHRNWGVHLLKGKGFICSCKGYKYSCMTRSFIKRILCSTSVVYSLAPHLPTRITCTNQQYFSQSRKILYYRQNGKICFTNPTSILSAACTFVLHIVVQDCQYTKQKSFPVIVMRYTESRVLYCSKLVPKILPVF